MSYNPATDYVGLWRNVAGQVSKLEVPGLDYVVAALARAGLITLSVSATAPVVSQSTTAWLQAAVPSYSAEGALFLWNAAASAYAAATPALLFEMLQTAAGQNGVSWWTTTAGAPTNTVGNDGDFAIRTDEPGGIYGPKAAGAWPANPLPGTTDIIGSAQLDLTFGTATGNMIFRGPDVWGARAIGTDGSVLTPLGGVPVWLPASSLLDEVFGFTQGSMLVRGPAFWGVIPPGTANQVLASGGPGAVPAWAPRTAEFPSGTVMLFQQTAAPTGWTKQTAINDYGLRVTSGAVGTVAGNAFSSVFAQTAVGNTTLNVSQIPPHTHIETAFLTSSGQTAANSGGAGVTGQVTAGQSTDGGTGGGGAHTHSVNLSLSYVDVIIAAKD